VKRRTLIASLPMLALPRAFAKDAPLVYDEVLKRHPIVFPRDYGAHPGFRTEWWYVTGALEREGAEACGFQITFFRSRTSHADANPSRFAPKQLLFAHAALALPERGKLIHEERAARAGPGGVRFSETDTAVAIGDWSFTRNAQSGKYEVRIPGRELDMTFEFTPSGPPVLQGENGYSQKGPKPEQSSHYYSEPQLKVTGRIAAGSDSARRQWQATGRAWLDHEWSSTLLDERAAGWDWIGINFDDGGSLMAFRIRTADGGTLWSHAARRDGQGRLFKDAADVRWTPQRTWVSPRSQARYPIGFEVAVGSEVLTLQPLMEDQEIDARMSTGGFYWEGAVVVAAGGRRVGRGYLELTGYAGKLKL
jgi:predicted secreted hydrolase